MSSWNKALDAAGIGEAGLRDDYTEQRKIVARYRRSSYLAARLLLPAALFPHVVAATGFMHHGDNVMDSGPVAERADAYAEWEKRVREALDTGRSDLPVLRALLNTIAAHPRLRGHVEEYLSTARTDLEFSGFATEADYQRYVDEYSLPSFMLIACLLAPQDELAAYRAACRTYIDGSQRLDFVNDLAEDLRGGRLAVPADVMERYGVTRTDLEEALDTPGTRELLQHLLEQASTSLAAARPLVDLVPPANRPLVRALIELETLTTTAAATKEIDLLRSPASPSPLAALGVLAREYLRARRLRP
ncbi:squalene/phytoene synthase family protein [Streptantibioticus rubrisoli]|uniref:Squalene/phytoene synthase family protein n=1 Tax=Streptantibioticus rubrisoli TaxID=1387313 RepID=A0ABT1P872_9ACTN|nr:squalene/phytoene synthase family protein [Streptantibioticus rubrisoli]MCQ4041572.1 squalene/phytoene synthase family protein [Streptantibioticus rubrisoli]